MGKTYRRCQSCGLTITEGDEGREDERYCSNCFVNGDFVIKDITLDEMKKQVTEELVVQKVPRFAIRMITKEMYKLERWRNL